MAGLGGQVVCWVCSVHYKILCTNYILSKAEATDCCLFLCYDRKWHHRVIEFYSEKRPWTLNAWVNLFYRPTEVPMVKGLMSKP